MSRLTELQGAFKRYLLTGDNEPDLAAEVRAACGVPAEVRLDVHRNAYYFRLQQALAHDFPAVLAFLGDAEFGRLTAAYLSQQASTRPSLRWLGERFEAFLRAAGAAGTASELARLEWALLHALDAPDAPRLGGLQDLPADRWPELSLALHPSVSLLTVHTNARSIWRAARDGHRLPLARHAGEFLLVFRVRGRAEVEVLAPGAHLLLVALASGRALGGVCETLSAALGAAAIPELVAGTLHRGDRLGWFVGDKPVVESSHSM